MILSLDYETFSECDLKLHGLDRYSAHPSTEVLMCAYRFNDGPQKFWDATEDSEVPADLRAALLDPAVEKWAFNAQFERVITRRVLKIKTPTRGWRCTMVLGFMLSFTGTLGEMGSQIGIPDDKSKDADGKRLIRLFSMPQKPTAKQPMHRLTKAERPEDWAKFCAYCRGDEIAEGYIRGKLLPYAQHARTAWEWHLYEIDQRINDRGLPVDPVFSREAQIMGARRQGEIVSEMRKLTGLTNPNSVPQLLAWLRDRGYWFHDLGKDTVKKVLAENGTGNYMLAPVAVTVLKLRQWAARISLKKHDSILKAADLEQRVIRFLYQFAGASRTNRWAGRRVQTQNLSRTPKNLEDYELLVIATEAIRAGDYDFLDLFVKEVMEALVGTVRSAFRTDDDEEFVVCDLASIESCVIGWLFKCERLLNVFRSGLDAYKDFATTLYNVPYDQVSKKQRTDAKPAVLGCGYRLGGGELREGKKTGLWGYAENMGINLTQEECVKAVELFRSTYPEIREGWFDLERAVAACVNTGVAQKCGYLRFEMLGGNKFLRMTLPSGRPIYYYKPRMVQRNWADGTPRKNLSFTYMGQDQKSGQWRRLENHGGRFTEQAVQGIARDVLAEGIKKAWAWKFDIRGHVHDEIKSVRKVGDDRFSLDRLREAMTAPLPWAPGLPLGGAGWVGPIYRKD